MNSLLEQFLPEARECLQSISENLIQLEQAPNNSELMNNLFRRVHTLKGNSGLFDFPEMTTVLSAGEDLMEAVRKGQVAYSRDWADQLLSAMDFVGLLCDDIELTHHLDGSRASDSAHFAAALQNFLRLHTAPKPLPLNGLSLNLAQQGRSSPLSVKPNAENSPLLVIPEAIRLAVSDLVIGGGRLHWLVFQPDEKCFLQGDDPFFTVRQTPGFLWGRIFAREVWPSISKLDIYRCILTFELLSDAAPETLLTHFRSVADQITLVEVDARQLLALAHHPDDEADNDEFFTQSLTPPILSAPAAPPLNGQIISHEPENSLAYSASVLPPPIYQAHSLVVTILEAQRQILMLDDQQVWQAGRVKAAASVLTNCSRANGDESAREEIKVALALSLATGSNAALLDWLSTRLKPSTVELSQPITVTQVAAKTVQTDHLNGHTLSQSTPKNVIFQNLESFNQDKTSIESADEFLPLTRDPNVGEGINFNRSDAQSSQKFLKIEQRKIDLLMDLIGEMMVSKNALPYLAQRAEEQFGVRELASQIKDQYFVISRIAEEMQSAIMQVCMMPMSNVFQRFPRLVRDLAHKLDKQVQLVLEGEATEADKNIIESLADPLMHIVRNSLDHGIETAAVRREVGKPATGRLTIRSAPDAGQILIEISDDGKGIDPAIIKHKAFEKGLIDALKLERISDAEAINLVFVAGFSTTDVVNDLSGRGVGLDVVKTAVEKVKGSITLESVIGQGTRIRIILPLSVALTKVMIVVTDGQLFGVPIEHVVATLRVPLSAIRNIKQSQTIVRRGVILSLKSLNTLLGIAVTQLTNSENEMAVLVVRVGSESVGIIVDEFHETLDVIQKPLSGVLAGLYAYSGSALMGNGSVLMVLDVKEIV
ncbi:Chemotaxis protein CheA [Polaromonas vacuolata]|uniref:Chemotaxis protein CheA n=1 Tax=Polaromonas vacuolata TaxID=37448 RepID=A0A6H2H8K0_9BURK|nr:chemotaxis protein CheA [Polaromonas vacuolata]QJC56198.1 Chemotaxis protein CheA [Polaromonas vacuolata]